MSVSMSRWAWAPWMFLAVAAGESCNHTPIGRIDKTLTLKVRQGGGTGEAVKVDFLWVVDNSSSMCQEQVSLTRNFKDFTDKLATYFALDSRLAVTTVDAQCDVVGSKGKFNTKAATSFPPACREVRKVVCDEETDCAGLDCALFPDVCNPAAQGEWACEDGQAPTVSCQQTPNGSINTQCRRRCTTDQECQVLFGDPTFICQKKDSTQANWGCLRPPDTAGCPDELPEFLQKNTTVDNIDLFPCLATVQVSGTGCLKYEQQMKSALLALDPTGPNHEQSARFLRPDAYLVIIFISDEEDCSADDDANPPIHEADYDTCGLLKTTDEGGPLTPVAHFVNRYKALKRDPSKVIVAAIAGDSTAEGPDGEPDPAQVALEREQFLRAKDCRKTFPGPDCEPRDCYQHSYICISANGIADYGRRFRELTESFGPNGTFGNICADEGIGPALSNVASTIIRVINKVCLPKEIVGSLKVERTLADGTVQVLTEGDGAGKYRIISNSEDCTGEGGNLLPAIAFGDPPTQGENIEITYQGDPELN